MRKTERKPLCASILQGEPYRWFWAFRQESARGSFFTPWDQVGGLSLGKSNSRRNNSGFQAGICAILRRLKKVVAIFSKVWYVLVLQKGEEATTTMRDYMQALYLRFKNPSQRSQELERETSILHKQLSARLAKPERRMLLRLVDLEDTLRNQTSLDSFMSGFRLAGGIQQELMEQPPYSFEAEEGQQGCERLERKGD